MKPVDENFTELKALLKDQEHDVPHRDLREGFLHDLHNRIETGERKSWLGKIKLPEVPNFAWAGVSFAALVVGGVIGIQNSSSNNDQDLVSNIEFSGSLTYVKMDERIDGGSVIPQFVAKPIEF